MVSGPSTDIITNFIANTDKFDTQKVVTELDQTDRAFKSGGTSSDQWSNRLHKNVDIVEKKLGSTKNVKNIGKEVGGEFIQNIGEGIGNGQGDLQDTILGTIGGVAPALGAAGAVVGIGIFAAQAIISGISSQNEKVKQAGINMFESLRDGVLEGAEREGILEKALGVDNVKDALVEVNRRADALHLDRIALLHDLLYPDEPSRLAPDLLAAATAQDDLETNAVEAQVAFAENRKLARDTYDILTTQRTIFGDNLSLVGEINTATGETKGAVGGVNTELGKTATKTEAVLTTQQKITAELEAQREEAGLYSDARQGAMNTEEARHARLTTKIKADIADAAETKTTKDDTAAARALRQENERHNKVMGHIGEEEIAAKDASDRVEAWKKAAAARVGAANKAAANKYGAGLTDRP